MTALSGAHVSYIADVSLEAAQRAGASYGVDSFGLPADLSALPSTDVVLLAIPVGARIPFYELFAARGTAVFAEKPLAIAGADAERICGLYADHRLACGFQRRAFATVDIARSAVAENWFGPIRSISIEEGARTAKTGTDARFYDDWSAAGGGILMDLGCHSLDMALFVSGATEAVPLHQRFVFDESIDRELRAGLRFRGPRGEFDVDLHVTWLAPTTNTLRIQFDACSLTLSCYPELCVNICDCDGHPVEINLTSRRRRAVTVYQAFYLEWEAFLDGARAQRASAFSGRSCLPTIRAVEALYAAGRRRRD